MLNLEFGFLAGGNNRNEWNVTRGCCPDDFRVERWVTCWGRTEFCFSKNCQNLTKFLLKILLS